MNAAFNIPPATREKNTLHLLIEVGSYGMSFVWFTKGSFSVKGLAVYNFSSVDVATEIKNIFVVQENYLSGLASTTICYDYRESLLIPGKYNSASVNEDLLSLFYGDNDDAPLNNDHITSANIYNHYRIPGQIEVLFSKQFPAAKIFHSTSLQLEQVNQKNDLLYCIVFHNTVKVIICNAGKLQIVQQFNYTSPDDVAYFLLSICEQHDVRPSEIQLCLSGMIDEQSRLYTELYQYFPKIEFENTADDIYASDDIKKLPAHFFGHLTALASCVS